MAYDMTKSMKSEHDLSANYAQITVTMDGRRYNMAMAKNLEVKANIETREVTKLGTNVKGHKAGLVTYSGTMSIYKCSEIFDKVVAEYTRTGVMPLFDVQAYNEDPAAADLGRSIKDYNDCILDGDVLLSIANSEGGSIEQEINFFADSVTVPEYLIDPSYM